MATITPSTRTIGSLGPTKSNDPSYPYTDANLQLAAEEYNVAADDIIELQSGHNDQEARIVALEVGDIINGSDDVVNDSGVAGATVSAALNQLNTDVGALGTDDITNDSGVTGATASAALDQLASDIAAVPVINGSDDVTNESGVAGASVSAALDQLAADAIPTSSGHALFSTTAGITASTTQTQGQGPLTSDLNEISVCANANDTVTLPSAQPGLRITVINNGANTLQVFPASGDNLGAGVDTATTQAAGATNRYEAYDATSWVKL